jgi:hypothetical protein
MRRLLSRALLGLAATGCALPAAAQGFAAYISPPRFELQPVAGETLRQVVEIQHVGREQGNYRVYTNDWVFNADHSVSFSDALAPDSCRPWVAIERRELAIEPGARYRYRFEITPPAGTPPRECRFAIMIEGLETARVEGQLNFPVGGRIGVIVYAAIGGAAPQLEIAAARVATVNGQPTAVIDVRNTGNAHGRIEGFVNGTDATGQRLELAPADLPILPGETRALSLSPVVPAGQPAPTIRFPLQVEGRLEWGANRLPLNTRFAP